MNRREFLKALLSLGAVIAVPLNALASLDTAPQTVIDDAWRKTAGSWGLFEVSEFGTLSYANFETPQTRREGYWYADASDLELNDIDSHGALRDGVQGLYRNHLLTREHNPDTLEGSPRLDRLVEDGWGKWFKNARGDDRADIERIIEDWLDDEIDWNNEWEHLYKSGTGQGAAYDHFLSEDSDVMDALSIVVVEGDCPGSSYFAAELHISPEEANEIAEHHGWQIRFVTEHA
jgi:hypothetical protein